MQPLGAPDAEFVTELLSTIARADVTVGIARQDPDQPDQIAYQLVAPLSPMSSPRPVSSASRSRLSRQIEIPRPVLVAVGAGAPQRLVTVTLVRTRSPSVRRRSRPRQRDGRRGHHRASSPRCIASLAHRRPAVQPHPPPDRRRTRAVRGPSRYARRRRRGSSREMAELTAAFNSMAERLRLRSSSSAATATAAATSWPTCRTSCARPSPRCAPSTSCSARVGAGRTRRAASSWSRARQQIERLDWLATNLLELSKLDSGLVLLDLRPDDLRAVVENAIQQAQPVADRKGVQLVADLPDRPGPPAPRPAAHRPGAGQPDRQRDQVHAARRHRCASTLEPTTTAPASGHRHGRGHQPPLSCPTCSSASTAAPAHEERAAGSGLGLSIVHSIVEMHDGRVADQQRAGQGTEVTVVAAARQRSRVSSPAAVRA